MAVDIERPYLYGVPCTLETVHYVRCNSKESYHSHNDVIDKPEIKKKVEESCSCWIDFLLSPAYFPDSGKAGARGVWWVCGGGGGLNGNRMTLYSPTVAVDLCLQLTCASPIIYLASLCFVMFTCSSDIVKHAAVIVCALAYMSTR